MLQGLKIRYVWLSKSADGIFFSRSLSITYMFSYSLEVLINRQRSSKLKFAFDMRVLGQLDSILCLISK